MWTDGKSRHVSSSIWAQTELQTWPPLLNLDFAVSLMNFRFSEHVCVCVSTQQRERERESITPPVFLCLRGFHSGWIRRMRAVIIAGKPAGRLRWQPVISAPHALKIPSRWHPFVPLPSPPFSPAIRLCSTYSAERISFLLLGTST